MTCFGCSSRSIYICRLCYPQLKVFLLCDACSNAFYTHYFSPTEHGGDVSEKQRQIVCFSKCSRLFSNFSERCLGPLLSDEKASHPRQPLTLLSEVVSESHLLLILLFKLWPWQFSYAYSNCQTTSAIRLLCWPFLHLHVRNKLFYFDF